MPYYDDILEFEPNLDGTDLRIGIVMSRFNIDIGEGLLSACTADSIHAKDGPNKVEYICRALLHPAIRLAVPVKNVFHQHA